MKLEAGADPCLWSEYETAQWFAVTSHEFGLNLDIMRLSGLDGKYLSKLSLDDFVYLFGVYNGRILYAKWEKLRTGTYDVSLFVDLF